MKVAISRVDFRGEISERDEDAKKVGIMASAAADLMSNCASTSSTNFIAMS